MSHEEIIIGHFSEKSTPKITGLIKDDAGIGIPGGSLDSLVLTLYDELTGNLLGSRPAQQDILGVNGGSVDVNGNFALQLVAADMAIENTTRTQEVHIALVEWKYNSSTLGNKINIKFTVANLSKVT